MLKFASIISGDDYQLLKSDTPTSRKKVKTLVCVLFLPVTMWFINVLLLATGVLQGSWTMALTAALIASGIIFMVERSIIMSNGSLTVMVFRVFLGFLIAILGSIAFDEVIFKSDIDQQMVQNKEILSEEATQTVDQSYQSKLASQDQLVQSKYALWAQSLEKVSKEADGTGGSGVRGVNDITRIKMTIAAENEKDYYQAKRDQETLQSEVSRKKVEAEAAIEASFSNDALLGRVKAIFDLICTDGWMCAIYIIVTLVLFCLEFIVVILKLSLPKSNYELKLEVLEEIGKQRMMKLLRNDMNHYDYSREYPITRRTNDELKKLTSNSIFN